MLPHEHPDTILLSGWLLGTRAAGRGARRGTGAQKEILERCPVRVTSQPPESSASLHLPQPWVSQVTPDRRNEKLAHRRRLPGRIEVPTLGQRAGRLDAGSLIKAVKDIGREWGPQGQGTGGKRSAERSGFRHRRGLAGLPRNRGRAVCPPPIVSEPRILLRILAGHVPPYRVFGCSTWSWMMSALQRVSPRRCFTKYSARSQNQ
jgi:hypothetical protein